MKEKTQQELEDNDEQKEVEDDKVNKIPWYMIDSQKNICRFWDLFITLIILYELIVVPFILVYPHFYQSMVKTQDGTYVYGNPLYYKNVTIDDDGNYVYNTIVEHKDSHLRKIEIAIDIIYMIEICLNFVKMTPAYTRLDEISLNYL